MSTEQSRALLKKLYTAVAEGDAVGALECLADDVVIHEPPFLPYGGVYRGKEEFAGLFLKLASLYDLSRVRTDYLVADGDRVFGVLRMPDLRTGEDAVVAERSIVRNGVVTDIMIFFHEAQSLVGLQA